MHVLFYLHIKVRSKCVFLFMYGLLKEVVSNSEYKGMEESGCGLIYGVIMEYVCRD